jgi:hypothetical protein
MQSHAFYETFLLKKHGGIAMRKTDRINPTKCWGLFVVSVGGLALLLYASQSWAGSAGPGWATRLNGAQTPATAAKTLYTYCVGGLAGTYYFCSIINSAPTADVRHLNDKSEVLFDTYLKTRGALNNGSGCYTSQEMATAISAKKQREDQCVYMKYKIVETNWTGNQ